MLEVSDGARKSKNTSGSGSFLLLCNRIFDAAECEVTSKLKIVTKSCGGGGGVKKEGGWRKFMSDLPAREGREESI